MSAKGFLGKEKKKISRIPTVREKLEYIWDYYKLWIIGAAALIVAVVYFLVQSANANKDHWFYLMLTNTMEEVGTGSEFCRKFEDYAGYDLTEKDVVFNNQVYFDFLLNTTGNTYFDTFIVYAETGVLDAITMETASLIELGQTGSLMDLNGEDGASILSKFEDRFLDYDTEEDEGKPVSYPVGIDLSDSILMTEYQIYGHSCALGIGYTSHRLDAVELFLDFVLEDAEAE